MSEANTLPSRRWSRGHAALLALAASLLAASWLLLALASGKSRLQQVAAAGVSRAAGVAQAVTRTGVTGAGTRVQVLFATPEYYDLTGQTAAKGQVNPLVYLVFIVTEENHSQVAPEPVPTLVVDGQPVPAPVKSRVLTASDHHRTRLLRFPRYAPDGTPYVAGGARTIELLWPEMRPAHQPDHTQANPLRWELPVTFPSPEAEAASPALFLALTGGLFAALSPCLVQLTLYYLSALAGASLPGTAGSPERWPVVRAALWFSGGIVLAYTAGGYLAGLVGNMLQTSNVLGRWAQPVAMAAGTALIVAGVYTGAAARAPGLCRLPLPALARFTRSRGGPAAMAMGFLVALGCLSCFGGAVFASLLLYAGSAGSPSLGALMLLLFSLGVAVPFVAAAATWSRALPYLRQVERAGPWLALGSSAVTVLFGVLMIFDRFHWVSGAILRWLPFLQS